MFLIAGYILRKFLRFRAARVFFTGLKPEFLLNDSENHEMTTIKAEESTSHHPITFLQGAFSHYSPIYAQFAKSSNSCGVSHQKPLRTSLLSHASNTEPSLFCLT
jgi:hypothetical protein